MKIELIDTPEEARELWDEYQRDHDCNDNWPGDDHTYWSISEDHHILGICSAVVRPDKGYVYLSYAVVKPSRMCGGLQRRLIQHRLRWAKRQGAIYAVTYTLLHNYPSIVNLLKCGFRFTKQAHGWMGVGNDVHYFEKPL